VTYYEELGVDATASADEIRQAFERLARPRRDENSRRVSETELQHLGGIAGILLDAGGRERYDRSLAALALAVTGEAQGHPLPYGRDSDRWAPRWTDLAVAALAVIAILLMLMMPAPTQQAPLRSPLVGQVDADWEPLPTPAYESHVPPPR